MSKDPPNLVAGRLGHPGFLEPPAGPDRPRPATSYGAERLGIVLDDEPPQEVRDDAPAPAPLAAEPLAASAQAESELLSDQPAESWTGEPSLGDEAGYADAPQTDWDAWRPPAPGPNWAQRLLARVPPDRRPAAGAAAGLAAGIVLVALAALGWWWFAGEDKTPQSASAEPAPALAHAPDLTGAQRPGRPRGAVPPFPRPRPLPAGGPASRPAPAGLPPGLADPPDLGPPTWPTTRPGPAGRVRRPGPVPAGDAGPPIAMGSPPGIQVSCVMRGLSGPIAIINDRCASVGKTIDGAKVIAISEFAVEVDYRGRRYRIGISQPSEPAKAGQMPAQTRPAESAPDGADAPRQPDGKDS